MIMNLKHLRNDFILFVFKGFPLMNLMMIMHRKSDRTTGTLDDDFSSIEILYNVCMIMNAFNCL